MAETSSDIAQSLGLSSTTGKLCVIQYISSRTNTTVRATGRLTTLEQLREDFPVDNIQVCPENNIEYYKKISEGGPRFFACQSNESSSKAYYWDNGNWYGYRSLQSVEFPNMQTVHDAENIAQTPYQPIDSRSY
ncbi:unnamed protein product [Rotaria magnacalcarata]|uniref:Uncharacterized protein n=1 Tax=Rotaria magnacalcarata TaxID=392030 RepID=A0A816YS24_9BILA|nr:unnamed protein product [Rotaria magnacalcarata]CAF2117727.1 unnamed protein product [Rotaria magnacalcarata]CAF2173733.1 unnamed protein product [Rotaria magnacalcarata]CAF3732227.1 unnamed protein product [Rotaria magnacalcarata]CAF3846531.1 unnamed protein product [Rotaria magnacalcarata]